MSDSDKPDPLARLGEELERARAARAPKPEPNRTSGNMQQGIALGLRIGMEFVVAIVVATGLGWVIDQWAGTRPWATIVLFFLGVGAGMVNVYRAVAGLGMAVGYRRDSDTKPPAKNDWDDEE
jgi:ATP synthase protein I